MVKDKVMMQHIQIEVNECYRKTEMIFALLLQASKVTGINTLREYGNKFSP